MDFSPRFAGLALFLIGGILFSTAGCKRESAADQQGENNAAYKEVTISVSGMA